MGWFNRSNFSLSRRISLTNDWQQVIGLIHVKIQNLSFPLKAHHFLKMPLPLFLPDIKSVLLDEMAPAKHPCFA